MQPIAGFKEAQRNECSNDDQKNKVVFPRGIVSFFVQPTNLGKVMQRTKYSVGEQKKLKRQDKGHNTRDQHEPYVGIIYFFDGSHIGDKDKMNARYALNFSWFISKEGNPDPGGPGFLFPKSN